MVLVKTNDGVLEGEIIDNEYGGTYCSFKGIPYAAPPVGDLRFKEPQPPKPWNGVRPAKEFGPISLQFNWLVSETPIGSEDCLYLNVYTPDIKSQNPLPVMFWIHGGGFMWGSGNDDFYSPEFLVRHGVILVTINYRLEGLGFLCLDTEDIPGNAGMKDQVAALRWVKNNISNFGGDPDNITIFGESAGSASVSFHLISPMTKGLFKRAIMQSGTTLCNWAQPFEPRERALVLARQLGCYSEDDKELYEFFKSQPPENFVKLKLPVLTNHKSYDLAFGIVDEKQFGNNDRFFYGDIIEVLKNNVHEGIDIIIGYTQDEGLMAFASPDMNIESLTTTANNYLEFFTPSPIKYNCPIKQQLRAGKIFKEFYYREKITSKNIGLLLKYANWDMFNYAIALKRDILAKNKKNVYAYKFCCRSERNVMANLLSVSRIVGDGDYVSHADDLLYLFDSKIVKSMNPKLEIDSETFKLIDTVTKLWTNFAKYGNPTPDKSLGEIWEPYTVERQKSLTIAKELCYENDPDQEEYTFWKNTFKEFLPEWTA